MFTSLFFTKKLAKRSASARRSTMQPDLTDRKFSNTSGANAATILSNLNEFQPPSSGCASIHNLSILLARDDAGIRFSHGSNALRLAWQLKNPRDHVAAPS
ncbi:hypothetical protein APHAL10511_005766 [Amanita phalloides]|nr:hypothetical protein APHAL10511_005766 [Amanita phalloides]